MKKLVIPPVFVLLSIILIVLFYFILSEYNRIPFPVNLTGVFIAFAGFVIMGKSRDLFKKYNTTLDIKKSSFLIKEGLFAKTRNPMYIGMFLFLLGAGVSFRNVFSVITSFGFLLLIQCYFIPKEERLLSETFGEEFSDYKQKVRRWF
jgi:protein-S-isoprenylcysteine O-methyltransferase Ste14